MHDLDFHHFRVNVVHSSAELLLGDLAAHKIHVVISDNASTSALKTNAHLIGRARLAIFGVQKLANKYRTKFPNRFIKRRAHSG